MAKLKVGDWERMVTDPGGAPARGKLPATPRLNPFTGARRLFQRTFQIRSQEFADGKFAVRFYPELLDACEISGSGGFFIQDQDFSNFSVIAKGKDKPVDLPAQALWYRLAGGNWDTIGTEAPRSAPDGTQYLPLNVLAGNRLIFGSSSSNPLIYRALLINGTWLEGVSFSSANTATFTVPSDIQGISFNAGFEGTSTAISVTVTYDSLPPANTPASIDIGSYNIFQTQAIELGEVDSYTIPAMSILASYSGNKFNSGGVIASARVRPGYTPSKDVYESITQLTDHNYRGPMETGTYVWYLPSTLQELESRGTESVVKDDLTSLIVAGQFTDEEGALQITLSVVVEFYSPRQIFEKEVSPPLTDEFVRAYHALDTLPAGFCNPDHKELLKKLIDGSRKMARTGGEFLMSHPEVLAALVGLL